MSNIFIVLPHDRFRDEEYTLVRTTLIDLGHQISVISNHVGNAHGHFGLIVKPDHLINRVSTKDFDAIIFIGGRGVEEFLTDSSITSLIQDASYQGKVIGALGIAVEVLANSGLLAGKKVTTDAIGIATVESCGGYYTGRLVEEDGNIITGLGVKASVELAKSVSARLK